MRWWGWQQCQASVLYGCGAMLRLWQPHISILVDASVTARRLLHTVCTYNAKNRPSGVCLLCSRACMCRLHCSAQSHCNRPDCPACACACYPPRSLCSYNLDTASSDRSTAQNYVSRQQGKQAYELCVGSLFLVLNLVYVPASHTVVLAVAAPAS